MLVLKSNSAYTGLSNDLPLISRIDNLNVMSALSLRRLTKKYNGPAIRVRRSTDNTEQDIGFVNNVLDINSLLGFASGGDAFVAKWYDQSGQDNYFSVVTTTSQPKIVSAGVLNTLNGSKPALSFFGKTNNHALFGSTALKNKISGINKLSICSVANISTTTNVSRLFVITCNSSSNTKLSLATDTSSKLTLLSRSGDSLEESLDTQVSSAYANTTAKQLFVNYDATANLKTISINGTFESKTPTTAMESIKIPQYIILGGSSFNLSPGTDYLDGKIFEFIILNNSTTESQDLINDQINLINS